MSGPLFRYWSSGMKYSTKLSASNTKFQFISSRLAVVWLDSESSSALNWTLDKVNQQWVHQCCMLWLTGVLMMYPNVRSPTGARHHPPPHPWCYSIFPRNWFISTGYLDPLEGKCLSIRPRPIVHSWDTTLLLNQHKKNHFCVGYSPIITNFIHVSVNSCLPSISLEYFITEHSVLWLESMRANHARCGRMAAYHMVRVWAHGQASPSLLLACLLLDTLLSTSRTSASVRTTLSLRFVEGPMWYRYTGTNIPGDTQYIHIMLQLINLW